MYFAQLTSKHEAWKILRRFCQVIIKINLLLVNLLVKFLEILKNIREEPVPEVLKVCNPLA